MKALQTESAQQPITLVKMKEYLVYDGRKIEIDEELTVGSMEQITNLTIDGLAPLHAKISRTPDGIYFSDLMSFGSYVNGERVHPEEARLLENNDEIRLGEVLLYFKTPRSDLFENDEIENLNVLYRNLEEENNIQELFDSLIRKLDKISEETEGVPFVQSSYLGELLPESFKDITAKTPTAEEPEETVTEESPEQTQAEEISDQSLVKETGNRAFSLDERQINISPELIRRRKDQEQTGPEIDENPPAEEAIVYEPAKPVASVVLRASSIPFHEMEITRFPFLIGSQSGQVDLLIDKKGVSRIHADIDFEDGNFYINDHNSTNGTLVNNTPVSRQKIAQGDKLTFGKVKYTVKEIHYG